MGVLLKDWIVFTKDSSAFSFVRDKFILNNQTPRASNLFIICGSNEEGPSVQSIFVFVILARVKV